METITELAMILLADEVLDELDWLGLAGVTDLEVPVPVFVVGGLLFITYQGAIKLENMQNSR